jgi:hypothetical protein
MPMPIPARIVNAGDQELERENAIPVLTVVPRLYEASFGVLLGLDCSTLQLQLQVGSIIALKQISPSYPSVKNIVHRKSITVAVITKLASVLFYRFVVVVVVVVVAVAGILKGASPLPIT